MKKNVLSCGGVVVTVVSPDNSQLEFEMPGMTDKYLPIQVLIKDVSAGELDGLSGGAVISKLPVVSDYEGYYAGMWGDLICKRSDVFNRLLTGCEDGDVDMLMGMLTWCDVPYVSWTICNGVCYAMLMDINGVDNVKFYWTVVKLYK